MKISVAKIPEEGLEYHFTRQGDWLQECGADREGLPVVFYPVEVSVSAKRSRETVYLEGKLATVIEAECCRCLEQARVPLAVAFVYTCVPAEDRFDEEHELRAEDLDFVFYTDDTIDLDPIVYEQIVLQIPLKILCRDECKGLCPRCGANLNTTPCQCGSGPADGPFAVLKKLQI